MGMFLDSKLSDKNCKDSDRNKTCLDIWVFSEL